MADAVANREFEHGELTSEMFEATGFRRPNSVQHAIRSETCQDEIGNLYTVLQWQNWPGSPLISHTLEDGTMVHYDDECYFIGELNKKVLRRRGG